MLTLTFFAFALLVGAVCLVLALVAGVILTVIGLPLALLFGFLPWLLKIAGVVLLIKGLLDQPFRWENLLPAVGAFLLAALIKGGNRLVESRINTFSAEEAVVNAAG